MPRKYWLLLFAAAAALLFAGNGSLLITDSVESKAHCIMKLHT